MSDAVLSSKNDRNLDQEISSSSTLIDDALRQGHKEQAQALFAQEYLSLSADGFWTFMDKVAQKTAKSTAADVMVSTNNGEITGVELNDAWIDKTKWLKTDNKLPPSPPLKNSTLEGVAVKFNRLIDFSQLTWNDRTQQEESTARAAFSGLLNYAQRLDPNQKQMLFNRISEINADNVMKNSVDQPRIEFVFRDLKGDGKSNELSRAYALRYNVASHSMVNNFSASLLYDAQRRS